MNDRSRPSLRRCYLFLSLLLGGAAAPLANCGPPDGAVVTAPVRAGCEAETQQNTQTNENMLPGRDCGYCHHAGGQAMNSPWTVSGTVFAASNSPCNPGGLANVFVEVQDAMGNRQDNGLLQTNSVGNFWSAASFTQPLKIHVYQVDPKDSTKILKQQTMVTAVGGMGGPHVDCAVCHQYPGMQAAPGRVFLN
jgi:Na+-translocating ferredoxin:NAD+ oxidoreductase RNF subunit RnfB